MAVMADEAVSGRPTVGLVLSGGGAKGVAHIGVIRAFEENGIPIDYVTGTSMGAIVGGLYAAGYSCQEMMSLLESPEFLGASQGVRSPDLIYRYYQADPTPAFVNLGATTDGKVEMSPLLPTSIISPMPMNFMFMQIFAPYTGQCRGDFDKLFVPFRCVATDVTGKRPHVFRDGQLGRAVRSSMSYPIVFKPVEMDSMMLVDGGIYDNFPIGTMRRDFNPDFIIGIDVHATDTIKHFPDIMTQLEMLVMGKSDYEVPADEGVKIRIDLNQFSLLDFARSKEIEEIGYRKGLAMVDSIKSRTSARTTPEAVARRRADFKAHTPAMVFDRVSVSGGSQAECDYVSSLFVPDSDADTFGIDFAREAYARALSTDRLSDLDPIAEYDPATDRFHLLAHISPKGNVAFGFGGYITSSANSMLYLSGNYRSLSFTNLDAGLGAWVGQNYMAAQLQTRYMLRTRRPSAIGLDAVIWRQKFNESDQLFYKDDSPAFTHQTEFFVRPYYSFATGIHSYGKFGVAYGHRDDRFFNNDYSGVGADARRNVMKQDMGQVSFDWEYTTLDDEWLPTAGQEIKAFGQGIVGHYHYRPGAVTARSRAATADVKGNYRYASVELDYKGYFGLSDNWTMGVESTVLMSTQKLLPTYSASLVNAPAFHPTASSYNLFNPNLRANQFVTLGVVPVYKLNDRLSLRGTVHGFVPVREIARSVDGSAHYGRWFGRCDWFAEAAVVIRFPFATLTAYADYQTTPGNKWTVGLSFGKFFLAPRMRRP